MITPRDRFHPTSRKHRTLTGLLVGLALVMANIGGALAQSQRHQDAVDRWEQQRQRDQRLDQQNDRAFQQRQWQRQQQETQRSFDQLEIERRQILNDRLDRRPLEFDRPPTTVVVPQQPTCRQYTQAYDAAGRPLGLICLR
ncbi:MAG: hypothetical protein EAZ99_13275 [Alphaproteobacteria bacterium]|nr:MAG: hypothetical protein EAZ99_13275 [Alphaproteobacteria bacterium]